MQDLKDKRKKKKDFISEEIKQSDMKMKKYESQIETLIK